VQLLQGKYVGAEAAREAARMCFNQPMSFAFAGVGLFVSWWIHTRTLNTELARGVFFFFTMEFLQGLQYFVIADDVGSPACDNIFNRILTVLGFLHICLQPYFCHVINASLTKSEKYLQQYQVIKRLCLIGGAMLFSRYLLHDFGLDSLGGATSGEWLRGQKLCTFRGTAHLAWSIPMVDVSYYVPSAAIHSFLMFAPFFALWEKKGMIIQGVFLWATGPLAASFISANLMEQASIWCFFSIAQISVMLFLIRETLVKHWGRPASLLQTALDNAAVVPSVVATGDAPKGVKQAPSSPAPTPAPKDLPSSGSKSNRQEAPVTRRAAAAGKPMNGHPK